MALALLNYPTLREEDRRWIEEVRRKHDQLLYGVVDSHFTIIFPTENIDIALFSDHIKRVSSGFGPIRFCMRCATIGDPDFWDHAHVFLIPDEGFSQIVKLHDAMYRGILESELRLELPFVPHIGIANDPSLRKCKAIVDDLNRQDFDISGIIEQLDIIEFDGKSTRTIERLELKKSKQI